MTHTTCSYSRASSIFQGSTTPPGVSWPMAVVSRLVPSLIGISVALSPGAERRRLVLPGLDHISIVSAESTHSATIDWLRTTVDARIGATPISADDRLHWLLLAFLSAAVALLPLLSLGSYAFGLTPSQGPSTR